MRRSSLEEFARDPTGRFVAGDSYVHFCAAPDLWGVVLWGRPDGAQAYALGRSLVLELAPPASPHVAVFDASRLVGSDPNAFRAAERYLASFGPALGAFITRLALIRPAGLSGAVVAGAFDVLPRPFEVEVFGGAAPAFAWLSEVAGPGGWPADGAAFLEDLHAEVTGTPRTLPALRAHLDGHLIDAALDAAARALGVSTRTLQRQLSEAETTFTAELAAARVRAARRMLVDTEASLTEIAMEVGCKTLQHFSSMFRRATGESPSAFRERARVDR